MQLLPWISTFADQWLGTALSKLFLLFLGILLCILVVAAVWDRRIKALGAALGISLGVLLAAIALTESVAGFFGGLDTATRLRLVAGFVSTAMLFLAILSFVRTGLHLRYGLLYTAISLIVLLTTLFPGPLRIFPSLLGLQYGAAVAALSILFLLLVVFHLSVVVSELQDRQCYLLSRVRLLEEKVFGEGKSDYPPPTHHKRNILDEVLVQLPGAAAWRSLLSWRIAHGTALTAPFIILLAVLTVTLTGMLTPQVMIGDEVTHFYMLQTQAKDLSQPNFFAEIPTGWGDAEVRRYPHSYLWHYFGAVLFSLTGGSFLAVQLYQAFFLAQLLAVAYLLARSRGGVKSRAALVYLLLVASLPMTLIFSVALYQDVPMAAQALTAFYFLRQRRWLLASVFMCLALGFKVNAMLFFPAFFVCLFVWLRQEKGMHNAVLALTCSVLLVGGFTFVLGSSIERYSGTRFYPLEKLEQLYDKVFAPKSTQAASPEESPPSSVVSAPAPQSLAPTVSEPEAVIIANHPGDLRIIQNYFVYGGVLLYLAVLCSFFQLFWLRFPYKGRSASTTAPPSLWLWGVGLSYILLAAGLLHTSPDARFFLPGLVFCLLPLAEQMVCLPKPRLVVIVVTALALMQSGYALAKTYHLRRVSPGLLEAIAFLREHPVSSPVFMYPEGNYRLFPVRHEWYLGYHLRDFWRADNDGRIAMLRKHGINTIVVKKHLISEVDFDITNLGVYPVQFVREIGADPRFVVLLKNDDVVIYRTALGSTKP